MELGAQTGALGLIPDLSLSDVEFRGATNLEVEVQGSNRAKMSLVQLPSLGLGRWPKHSILSRMRPCVIRLRV